MRWKYAALVSCFFISDTGMAPAETFRLEAVVQQEDQSCKYTLSRPDWKSKIGDLLRTLLEINIQYVRLEQARNVVVTNIGQGQAVKFSTVYKGMALDGDGGEIVHEIINIEGVALLGKDNIVVKVTNTNHVFKPFLSGRFITCEPVSVPADTPLSLEDMRKMETNRLREFETNIGDAMDHATGFGLKQAANAAGPAKSLIKKGIDSYVDGSKRTRNEALKSSDTSALEWSNHRAIERNHYCNTYLRDACKP
ncbi:MULTISPECIES: hypothetical protein [Rhizobium]|uniref:hypothetical protein n=1 Tax=Rhizobium TaxID=379 RepID=UPI0028A97FE2